MADNGKIIKKIIGREAFSKTHMADKDNDYTKDVIKVLEK